MISPAGGLAARIRIRAGVIDDARERQRRRHRAIAAWLAIGTAVAIAALVSAGGGPRAPRVRLGAGHRPPTNAVRDLRAGRAEATFSLREPAGVVLLARISAPRGVRAVAVATIPGVAGITLATTPGLAGLDGSCVLRAATNACTTAVEWCPMPAASWRVRVAKSAGPEGEVRVDLVVGPQPHAPQPGGSQARAPQPDRPQARGPSSLAQ